jgi:hypothetical protein
VPFQLLESLSLPGDPAKPNEDAFAHGPRFAVVFDGATGLGENLLPGPSDAQWIARFGARRLSAHAGEGDGTPRDWLKRTAAETERSFIGLRRRAPASNYEIPFASMMCLALRRDAIEALWFGDCAVLIRAPDGSVSTIGDTMQARLNERDRARGMAKGREPAAAGVRAEFLPALRAARNKVNTQEGGWLFSPDAACADHAQSRRAAVAPGALLLLASDGFLALMSDYERYEAAGLLAAAETRGLKSLAEELRQIEAGDPGGASFPRFKKSDDSTALLLRVA